MASGSFGGADRRRMARLAYLGTPELAVRPLAGLLDAGHEIALVVTRPDAKRGRGGASIASPVKQFALDHDLNVTDDLAELLKVPVDLAVVVAYGRIIPTDMLDAIVMLNLHFSLLPRWRGAAPVERAILAGDLETGVCVMAVEPELDTGPVFARRAVPVGDKTLGELQAELSEAGTELLVELLSRGVDAIGTPAPQEGEVTYAKKIVSADHELDLTRPADEILRTIRLGRAFTWLDGRRLRIQKAHRTVDQGSAPGILEGVVLGVGEGAIEIDLVQPEGKRVVPAADWRRGLKVQGTVLLGTPEREGIPDA